MYRTVINKRAIAALKMPRSVPKYIIYVKGTLLKLNGNANFPLPYPSLTSSLETCDINVNALEAAEAFAQTHAPGSIATRDLALEISKRDMRTLQNMVQTIADDNVANAAVIIESAGMTVQTLGGSVKKEFGAKNTLVSGTVKLFATGIKRGEGAHLWFYTTDLINYTNRIAVGSTTKASTTIEGLTEGTRYAFFHTAIVPGGPNIEEGPVFLSVI